jgi:hypothetical protein
MKVLTGTKEFKTGNQLTFCFKEHYFCALYTPAPAIRTTCLKTG